MKKRPILRPFAVAVAMASTGLLAVPSARAADAEWTLLNANGNWNTNGNWTPAAFPGAVSPSTTSTDTASFTQDITGGANITVTIPGNFNIGNITFGHGTDTYGYVLGAQAARYISLSDGGMISQTGTGNHDDSFGSKIHIEGDGGSATFKNDSSSSGLTFGKSVEGVATAGNTTTLYLDGTSTLNSIGGQNTTIGVIGDGSNGGKLAVVKNGVGLWTLNGNNTFTGGLTVNAGTIRYFGAGNNSFGMGTVTIADGVSFQKANSSAVIIDNAMTVNGNFRFFGNDVGNDWSGTMDLAGGTRTITADADLTISGVISNGGLTKAGTDILTLSNTNTYTGATTVSAGTLTVTGTGSINTSSGVSVANSATLTNDSSTSFATGLTLAEGATVNGTGAFAPTALTLTADLSDGFTTFAFGGTSFAKGNGLELTLSGIMGGDYTLFSGSALTGAFTSLSIGGNALTDDGGGDFSGTVGGFDYAFVNGTNILSVTAVPEPSAWALMAGGLAVVVILRRRRTARA